jgi:hypothetical protein
VDDWKTYAAAVVVLLNGSVTVWILLRKNRREDRTAESKQTQEDRAADQALKAAEQAMDQKGADYVVAHLRKMMRDQETTNDRNVRRLEAEIGELSLQLRDCEDRHRKQEIENVKMRELMRYKGLLTETEEHTLLREVDLQVRAEKRKEQEDSKS